MKKTKKKISSTAKELGIITASMGAWRSRPE